MKLLDSGETELEPCDDDIVMRELVEEHLDDKRQEREYLFILFYFNETSNGWTSESYPEEVYIHAKKSNRDHFVSL